MRKHPIFAACAIVLGALLLLVAGALFLLTQPFVMPIASQPPVVDAVALQRHVQHLSVTTFGRSFDQPERLARAAHYIYAQLQATGATVRVQPVEVNGQRFENIVARFGPATGDVLVVGAHYDSHGDEENAGAPTPATHTPGADDNASGVAGLIELARLLVQHPPSHPVELVAYTLEEPPHFRTAHMGSAWHVRQLQQEQSKVRLMLSLEMIGTFIDTPGSQRYPIKALQWLYPNRGDFVALVGQTRDFAAMRRAKALMAGASPLPVESINAPRAMPGVDFSDHHPYWNARMPAMMVTDTAFMRNLHYHEAGDTWEKLDYQRMAQVVQGVYAVVQNF